MKTIQSVSLFLLLAASASAQTAVHECDKPVPPNVTVVGRSITVGFCANGKDDKGGNTTLTAFKIYIDGAVALTWDSKVGPLTPTSPTANSQGYLYYEAPAIPIGRGAHAVTVSATNVDSEGKQTTALPLTLQFPPPSLVIGVRVR